MLSLKKRTLAAAAVTAAVLIVLGFASHFTGVNPIKSAVKTVFTPFRSGVSYICSKAERVVNFIWEMDTYKDMNEQLQARINELEKKKRDSAQYREENEYLKGLLELRDGMKGYTSLAASVIGCSKDGTYTEIEINKGTLNGVSVGNCVVANGGAVGTVTEAGPNWATVSTILSSESAVGIRVTRTDGIGIVEGDNELAPKGFCKMSFLDKNSNVTVGDLLQTSGSGGVYPAGFIIGKVREIRSDNSGALEYAAIEPAVNFSKLYGVLVINGLS